MSKYKDTIGNEIYFPRGKRWYFDKALNRRFYSKKQKYDFMISNGIYKDTSNRVNFDRKWEE